MRVARACDLTRGRFEVVASLILRSVPSRLAHDIGRHDLSVPGFGDDLGEARGVRACHRFTTP